MRRPWTSFYDNKFTAFIVIVGVFIVNVGFSVFKAFEYEIISIENVDVCHLVIKIATFKYAVAHIFAKRGGSFVKVVHTTESIFSSVRPLCTSNFNVPIPELQIIPCILFPIFTFLLLGDIRKAEKHRVQHLSCPVNNKKSRKTTKLVLYLTVAFLIAGFPLGVTNACTYIFAESPGFL
ncbi:hypothetical protein B9Z55_017857 [Caenorhabditis nigoni]|uniref:G-protein coupled receptors family 1 profile domain-containing protein n=1 Tax=Caenorhabditis nigoni TaxID=1611254 RepID=A0A2G5TBU0_9PELO|nr:hypothetical protein B9Z55_017857 [Caenorhabditis nigoni]